MQNITTLVSVEKNMYRIEKTDMLEAGELSLYRIYFYNNRLKRWAQCDAMVSTCVDGVKEYIHYNHAVFSWGARS